MSPEGRLFGKRAASHLLDGREHREMPFATGGKS